MNVAALQDRWYGQSRPGPVLRGLERVYRRLLERDRRRGLARRCAALEARPVVVVGNLTVGGTGKTPLVIRLCELLAEGGIRPGVVSRGHGRQGRAPLRVQADTPPAQAGDEPLLIARRCGVPVRVDRDREAAALALFEEGVDLVIADDGLQRWRLPRDLELCVVDGRRGFGNGHLLPAGPLREPISRLASVDEVIVNGRGAALALGRDHVPMALEADTFLPLAGGGPGLTADALARHLEGRAVHAVAGIGDPGRFFGQLAELGVDVDHEHSFPDHHRYRARDFAGMQGAVLMTEKDAVKCRGLAPAASWYLPVHARLPEAWEQGLVRKLQTLVSDKTP